MGTLLSRQKFLRYLLYSQGLFEQLPDKLKSVQGASATPKKRSASSKQPTVQLEPARSAPDVARKSSPDSNAESQSIRASTSPHPAAPTWKHSSIPYESSSLRQQVIDTSYHRSSHDTYSPTTTHSMGVHTPDSPNDRMPSSATQPNFPRPANMAGGGLFDLSAMMFPSTDPFAYPNQPMTTLENCQLAKQEYPYDPNLFSQTSNSTTGPAFENLDAQLFGPMPSYVIQGQTSGNEMQNISVPFNTTGGTSTSALSGADGQWAPQHSRTGVVTPGMNLDQIFGEDWSVGWMDQGYRQ